MAKARALGMLMKTQEIKEKLIWIFSTENLTVNIL